MEHGADQAQHGANTCCFSSRDRVRVGRVCSPPDGFRSSGAISRWRSPTGQRKKPRCSLNVGEKHVSSIELDIIVKHLLTNNYSWPEVSAYVAPMLRASERHTKRKKHNHATCLGDSKHFEVPKVL